MKVSIIVPIYNVEKYVEKCVRSLFEQSYKYIEYIFVNDASKDNSFAILNKLIDEYKPDDIKLVHHEVNKGLPSARNSGLQSASGDYVLHCDGDDWMDNMMVERLINNAIHTKADIVFCDFYNVYYNEPIIYNQQECNTYEDYITSFINGKSQASVWNKLISRSLYTNYDIRFPDGAAMLEDFRTIIQLYFYARKISYCPQPLYYYVRTREESISGANNNNIQNVRPDLLENIKGIIRFLNEKGVNISNIDINRLKLGAKKNLLVKGRTLGALKTWKNIFPEANNVIWETDYPIVYKILAFAIGKEWWLLTKIWILIKYNILRK